MSQSYASAGTAEIDQGFRQTVVFIADGTFSKATYPWLKRVRVRVVGAGAAGGGCSGTASNQFSVAGGGGGGGYSEVSVEVAALSASETVQVGVGGAGVSAADGNDGEDSFLGTHGVAEGGFGGKRIASPNDGSFVTAAGGAGGRAGQGTGDVTAGGAAAHSGYGFDKAALQHQGGAGGASALGGGGVGGKQSVAAAGELYGGGGGGPAIGDSTGAQVGGAGADGIVIVELYG